MPFEAALRSNESAAAQAAVSWWEEPTPVRMHLSDYSNLPGDILCHDPAITRKHMEHLKYVSFSPQSVWGLTPYQTLALAYQEIRFYLHTPRGGKKKEKKSLKSTFHQTHLPVEKGTLNTHSRKLHSYLHMYGGCRVVRLPFV